MACGLWWSSASFFGVGRPPLLGSKGVAWDSKGVGALHGIVRTKFNFAGMYGVSLSGLSSFPDHALYSGLVFVNCVVVCRSWTGTADALPRPDASAVPVCC